MLYMIVLLMQQKKADYISTCISFRYLGHNTFKEARGVKYDTLGLFELMDCHRDLNLIGILLKVLMSCF